MIRNNVLDKIRGKAPLQPYTTEEMASLYNITTKTFLKWIEPFVNDIGEKIGWYFNVRQVEVIFEKIGRPEIEQD